MHVHACVDLWRCACMCMHVLIHGGVHACVHARMYARSAYVCMSARESMALIQVIKWTYTHRRSMIT